MDKSGGNDRSGAIQHDQIRSCAMPTPWVRAAIVVRCNSALRGHSAVSPDVVKALLKLLECGITPIVPLRGSISASGDLGPLSYIAGVLEGNPDIYAEVRGSAATTNLPRTMRASDALSSAGLNPRDMGPKESLSVMNGTSSSAALASLVVFESHMLSVLVQALSALAVEALNGNSESFHPFISMARPHAGQIECARNVLHLLQGSLLAQNMNNDKDRNRSGLIQDRYALRSVPQWIGPQLEDLLLAHRQVETELNSSCDNPLVDSESKDIYYGCNFQAASITSAMEKTRTALQMLGKIIFAQTTEMIEPHLNNGLPTNLVVDDPSLSFTMKGVDTNMAAYMTELAFLAHPVSAHIQAAEMHNQSVNSMALTSSRFSMDSVEVLSIMCACHLYVGCQALDLRALHVRFLERAPEKIFAIAAQNFTQLSEEVLHKLNGALKRHVSETWPKTNRLAIEERCEVTVKTALDVIVDIASLSTDVSGLGVTDLSRWKSQAIRAMNELYNTILEQFIHNPHTPELIGGGSKILYHTVRHTLNVPFHMGLSEHPTVRHEKVHGRDKKTIGSWISIIYEAIRSGTVIEPLMDLLKVNTSGTPNHT
ncbi:hypothetical protein QQS21_005661 [Conoideocrella luteorostrata]|uniref:Phenylalanine ammonia-lyase n=1 Tax=Conoideocrella luteorostrata TaxID=1105319 RepID=A0AAJ0CNZ0_9HYPO|nr:hypothetical protein QQS21_005661 [Conoideocrella luteorostrata]